LKLERIRAPSFTASVIESRLPRDAGFCAGTRSTLAIEAQTPPAQSSTVIESIQVVDVKDLKPEVPLEVDDVVAHTSEEICSHFGSLLTRHRRPASALKAKGLNSSEVVAINMADGI